MTTWTLGIPFEDERIVLHLDSDDPEVVAFVETAADRNGVSLVRVRRARGAVLAEQTIDTLVKGHSPSTTDLLVLEALSAQVQWIDDDEAAEIVAEIQRRYPAAY